MKRSSATALSVGLCLSAAAAWAEPPGFAKAGGARAKEVLTEVHGRVPEPARAAIQRSREVAGEDAGDASEAAREAAQRKREAARETAEREREAAREAAEREREHGPGRGRHSARRGAGASGEVPNEIGHRGPEHAKPASGVNREARPAASSMSDEMSSYERAVNPNDSRRWAAYSRSPSPVRGI